MLSGLGTLLPRAQAGPSQHRDACRARSTLEMNTPGSWIPNGWLE